MIRYKWMTREVWKKKGMLLFSAMSLLLFLFFLLQIVMPCKTYHVEGAYTFDPDIVQQGVVLYGGISLQPGVYRVALSYETGTDQNAFCEITDGSGFTGGLLADVAYFYTDNEQTDSVIWLFEGTKDLQLTVTYGGIGTLHTGNLTIIETNQLWTMCMTVLCFVWVLGCIVLHVFYYTRSHHPLSMETKHVLVCLFLIILLASTPYLCGYNIAGAELTDHLQRIEALKEGHGYTNEIFAYNVLLYVPVILRNLGFPISTSYNLYCIMLNIVTTGIAYYCFRKIFHHCNIAIVCTAFYTLSIFRIYKLVFCAAVGEGSALAFLPLVLYGLYQIFIQHEQSKFDRTAWVPFAVGFTGLIQTHIYTWIMTLPIVGVYILVLYGKRFRKKLFGSFLQATAICVCVGLLILLPIWQNTLMQGSATQSDPIQSMQSRGIFMTHLLFHFWTNGSYTPAEGEGLYHSQPIGIGLVLMVGLCLFLILWFGDKLPKDEMPTVSFVKKTALVGVVLLMMSMHFFPWDRIQNIHPIFASMVRAIRSPDCFLGWATVCLVVIFGWCLSWFEQTNKHLYVAMLVVAVLSVTTSSLYLLDFINAKQNYVECYDLADSGQNSIGVAGEERGEKRC